MLLRNVLTPEECSYLIRQMSDEMEPVKYRHDYRRNDRAIFESRELAELLWRRVEPSARSLIVHSDMEGTRQKLLPDGAPHDGLAAQGDCPEELRLGYGQEGVWHPVGLNECLRFCRYAPGGFFRAHCDASFQRSEDEQSLFTCMFYLDGSMEGGATRFLHLDAAVRHLEAAPEDQVLASVEPRAGQCLLFFQQGLLHEGAELLAGEKHILRTEVMFRRDPATKPQLLPHQAEALRLLRQAQAAEEAGRCEEAVGLYRRAFKLDPRTERMC
uniref:Fe2OG dioxygenase domain-containing protein n=1 Tax=Alexandrium catenella TaxID=2925 RepID=A0A7S1WTW0_ALECA|mmetsp:Transcript_89153/g.236928  ORF Transcript_89153/g.236928 Transcript_89153/m.236928 type:complete len:271 (+) Transcript_89153:179-991(+)